MTDRFTITYDWLSRDYGDAIERVTLADLAIRVAGKSATKLEDKAARTIRDASRLSAYHLARWLAANWWRLRWEPDSRGHDWLMSHQIGAAGGGYSWPNVTFLTDGSNITVRARPTDTVTDPVRYLADFDERIAVNDFEATVDDFVTRVLMRLDELGVAHSDLKDLWRELSAEREDPDVAAYRKLEALLSYDPGEAPEDFVMQLQEKTGSVGLNAVQEIAAASKWEALQNITQLVQNEAHGSTPILVPNVEKLRRRISGETPESLLPWERASVAARIVRQEWDIAPGPLPTIRLAEILHFDPALIVNNAGNKLPMEAAFRQPAHGEKVNVLLKHARATSRRFGLGRLIADHITADSSDHLLPATDAKTARQKFQRAFAQKFLCPPEDLRAELRGDDPSDDEIEEKAERYDVSEMVVRNILVDEGRLVRDWRWD